MVGIIWQVSLICDGNSFANSNKTFLTKIDKFPTSVLQPLVINLTGLFMCLNVTIHLPGNGARTGDKRVVEYLWHLSVALFILRSFRKMVKQISIVLLNTEKKLCKLLLHKKLPPTEMLNVTLKILISNLICQQPSFTKKPEDC